MSHTLTPAELDALRLLAEDLGSREIAARRGVADSTVRQQLHACYRKLGVRGAVGAVVTGIRLGLIPNPATGDQTPPCPRPVALRDPGRRDPVTDTQRRYLAEFDVFLRARDDDARCAARARMDQELAGVLGEAGVARTDLPVAPSPRPLKGTCP